MGMCPGPHGSPDGSDRGPLRRTWRELREVFEMEDKQTAVCNRRLDVVQAGQTPIAVVEPLVRIMEIVPRARCASRI